MDRPTQPGPWRTLAEVLATMPENYRILLDVHVDAGCGRCRACTVAGTGSPGAVWPCPVRQLAVLARDIHHERLVVRAAKGPAPREGTS